MPDDYTLTSLETAAFLHITDSTIRAQRKKGKLTGMKRAGAWFFTLEEVQRYARENQVLRKGGRSRSTTAAKPQVGPQGGADTRS